MTDPGIATKARILVAAGRLMRTVGYNAFSYADISKEIGISKASIHHHYSSKAGLARALISETKHTMEKELAQMKGKPAFAALKRYFDFFEASIAEEKICLCGMLLAETDGLPDGLRSENQKFVDWQLNWIKAVLEEGREAGELHFDSAPLDEAEFIYGTLQGIHIVAKARKDLRIFAYSMQTLMDRYEARRRKAK